MTRRCYTFDKEIEGLEILALKTGAEEEIRYLKNVIPLGSLEHLCQNTHLPAGLVRLKLVLAGITRKQ